MPFQLIKSTGFPHFYYDTMQKTSDFDNKDFRVMKFW